MCDGSLETKPRRASDFEMLARTACSVQATSKASRLAFLFFADSNVDKIEAHNLDKAEDDEAARTTPRLVRLSRYATSCSGSASSTTQW